MIMSTPARQLLTVMTDYHGADASETDYIRGETGDGTSAVVDYIDYTGADGFNFVTNNSMQGMVVKFGTNTRIDEEKYDKFDAQNSGSNSNVIDLRYEDNVTITMKNPIQVPTTLSLSRTMVCRHRGLGRRLPPCRRRI